MFTRHLNYLSAPIDSESGGGPSGEMSKDDIIDYLGSDDEPDENEDEKSDDKDDDDETEPKKPSKSKDKDDKSDKSDKKKSDKSDKDDDDESDSDSEDTDDGELDLDELEEDLKDVDDEKLELVTPVSRAKILKKYPNLFKEFPYLEKAYFREQQFTEVFSHPKDAKDALNKAETLDRFESDLMAGNTETILKVIHDETPNSFNKLVDNYLPTLMKIDPAAHTHVVGNIIKQTIMAMVRNGRTPGNEALGTAAQILNQFVFQSNEFEPPSKLAGDEKSEVVDEEKVQLRRDREALVRQRFDDARGELNTRVNNSIKATIETNIDPRDSMSDYVKRNAVRDALEQIETLISKDTRFKQIVDKLWERSYKDNFSKASQDNIRSAYVSKAKTLLGAVIKKSRNDALKGMGKRVKSDKTDDAPTKGQRSKENDDERPRSKKSSGKSSGVPAGMSSLEFLMQDD